MRNKTVVTSNLVRCLRAVEALRTRPEKAEGMALLFGLTGEGKTTAVTYVANREDAIYIRANATWTARSMLQTLSDELELSRTNSLHPMLHGAIHKLRSDRRPLLFDEADYLTRSGSTPSMFDVLRDLYDETKVPVLLIGSRSMARSLRSNSRYALHQRRISQWVEFAGVTLEDARGVVEQLCEVRLTPDLVEMMFTASRGNMAALTQAILEIEEFAAVNELPEVNALLWGNRPLPQPTTHGFFGHEGTS